MKHALLVRRPVCGTDFRSTSNHQRLGNAGCLLTFWPPSKLQLVPQRIGSIAAAAVLLRPARTSKQVTAQR